MAYDKVIDSTKLDGAMTATANAIRAKTGDAAKLTWDETNGFKSAVEDIPVGSDPVLQEKSVTPTTSAQEVTADSGYDGLSKVNVGAMPTATQATPSITVSSTGLITASAEQSAGYVAAGTKSATKQLSTQAAKTITPSTSEQTAVASGKYTTGAIKVAKIPSTYVKPTATKAATTYTPTTTNQTIAAGTYCSGAQTIKGDSNLVASNIKSGVSIFGVTGSYTGSGGMQSATGTITPTSNLVSGSGTVVITLTGLTFKPQFVAVFLRYKTSVNSSAEYVFGGAMKGLAQGMVQYTVGNSRLDAEGESCYLTITSDGFTIATDTSDTCQFGTSYEYIAIG